MYKGRKNDSASAYGSFVIGLDVDTVGVIVGVSALIDMVFFFPAGLIMDRFGRKFASVPAFVMLSAGMLFVAFSFDAVTLFLAATVMSVGNGLGSGSMMTLGADLSPPEARGEFIGFWRLVGDSGSTGGPLLVGGVADLLGVDYRRGRGCGSWRPGGFDPGSIRSRDSSPPNRQSAWTIALAGLPLAGQVPRHKLGQMQDFHSASPGLETAPHLHNATGIVGNDDLGLRVAGAA